MKDYIEDESVAAGLYTDMFSAFFPVVDFYSGFQITKTKRSFFHEECTVFFSVDVEQEFRRVRDYTYVGRWHQ